MYTYMSTLKLPRVHSSQNEQHARTRLRNSNFPSDTEGSKCGRTVGIWLATRAQFCNLLRVLKSAVLQYQLDDV